MMPVLKGKIKLLFLVCIFILFTTYSFNGKFFTSFFLVKKVNIVKSQNIEEHIKDKIISELNKQSILKINNKKLSDIFNHSQWIKEFKVKKIYPNEVSVIITEYVPIAAFKMNNAYFLINENFIVTRKLVDPYKNKLIIFSGNPKSEIIKSFYLKIKNSFIFNDISQIKINKIARKDVLLKNGLLIKFGDYDDNYQLNVIKEILKKNNTIKFIDTRIQGRAIIK